MHSLEDWEEREMLMQMSLGDPICRLTVINGQKRGGNHGRPCQSLRWDTGLVLDGFLQCSPMQVMR